MKDINLFQVSKQIPQINTCGIFSCNFVIDTYAFTCKNEWTYLKQIALLCGFIELSLNK